MRVAIEGTCHDVGPQRFSLSACLYLLVESLQASVLCLPFGMMEYTLVRIESLASLRFSSWSHLKSPQTSYTRSTVVRIMNLR